MKLPENPEYLLSREMLQHAGVTVEGASRRWQIEDVRVAYVERGWIVALVKRVAL